VAGNRLFGRHPDSVEVFVRDIGLRDVSAGEDAQARGIERIEEPRRDLHTEVLGERMVLRHDRGDIDALRRELARELEGKTLKAVHDDTARSLLEKGSNRVSFLGTREREHVAGTRRAIEHEGWRARFLAGSNDDRIECQGFFVLENDSSVGEDVRYATARANVDTRAFVALERHENAVVGAERASRDCRQGSPPEQGIVTLEENGNVDRT
jgi:hypothetical protein